jgi:hypothetical protein
MEQKQAGIPRSLCFRRRRKRKCTVCEDSKHQWKECLKKPRVYSWKKELKRKEEEMKEKAKTAAMHRPTSKQSSSTLIMKL